MQVVHTRDRSITWSTSVYCIRPGSQVYGSLLDEFPESHEDRFDDEHCFSIIDRWSVEEDHTDFRGHAASMRPGSQG